MKATPIKAVFFDKDGVLHDSLDICFRAFNKTLKHYGKPKVNKKFFIKYFWGISGTGNSEKVFGHLTKNELDEIFTYYKKVRKELENYYLEKGKIGLYPDARYVLKKIKGNYKIALITNSNRRIAIKSLQKAGILNFFNKIVGVDDAKPKPAPDPIIKACKELKVKPSEVLYVGDTFVDIEASKSAGCITSIITNSVSKKELKKQKNILILENLKDILKVI